MKLFPLKVGENKVMTISKLKNDYDDGLMV